MDNIKRNKYSKTHKIDVIVKRLKKIYRKKNSGDHDPFKVLIKTILSQRTRDENTAQASELLFSKYKTPEQIIKAESEEIEKLIRKAGFFRVKAQRIKEVSRMILDDFDGVVPDNLNDLLKLPGVGRKTANCVLVYGFKKKAIPVDVHVHRISNRIGIVNTRYPEETEIELQKIVPKKYWMDINDLFVQLGQDLCRPINPKHMECPINGICDYFLNIQE
jgi:endonuclease III